MIDSRICEFHVEEPALDWFEQLHSHVRATVVGDHR